MVARVVYDEESSSVLSQSQIRGLINPNSIVEFHPFNRDQEKDCSEPGNDNTRLTSVAEYTARTVQRIPVCDSKF